MDVLAELEPKLDFDEDGLLVGPKQRLRFTKEGVLTREHWIQYDADMPGGGKSGAFLEDLLATEKALAAANQVSRFGVAIQAHVVLAARHHARYMTEEYIRGPRVLSAAALEDPRFPEDPSGTVTEHRRVQAHPLHLLFPLERTEVMWSYRDGVKTVQIEELQPCATDSGDIVANRYVHGRWSDADKHMIHFDGALRTYAARDYPERLATDMKKFSGRAASYRKLFRIDAPFQLADWARLTTKFFESNELVLEYFENLLGDGATASG